MIIWYDELQISCLCIIIMKAWSVKTQTKDGVHLEIAWCMHF